MKVAFYAPRDSELGPVVYRMRKEFDFEHISAPRKLSGVKVDIMIMGLGFRYGSEDFEKIKKYVGENLETKFLIGNDIDFANIRRNVPEHPSIEILPRKGYNEIYEILKEAQNDCSN